MIKPFNNEGFIEIPVVWRPILGNRREVNLLLSIVVGVVKSPKLLMTDVAERVTSFETRKV